MKYCTMRDITREGYYLWHRLQIDITLRLAQTVQQSELMPTAPDTLIYVMRWQRTSLAVAHVDSR